MLPLWLLPRRRRLPLRDEVERFEVGLPLAPLAGAATASRSHAQSTVNLVVLSSSARSYGTRGVELWDDSQGRGEGYDAC